MLSKKQVHAPHKTDTGISGNWLCVCGLGFFLSRQMCIVKTVSVNIVLFNFIFYLALPC